MICSMLHAAVLELSSNYQWLFDRQQTKTHTSCAGCSNNRQLTDVETDACSDVTWRWHKDTDIVVYQLWQFTVLFDLAVKYLSVPGNSVDAECSLNKFAPQHQNFTDPNLAVQVMMVVNSRNWLLTMVTSNSLVDTELAVICCRDSCMILLPIFWCNSLLCVQM